MSFRRLADISMLAVAALVPDCSSKERTVMTPEHQAWFQQQWHKADSLYNQGLPKSALEVIEPLIAKAEKIDNRGMAIKGMIYRFRYVQEVEEETFVKVQQAMVEEVKKAPFPYSALLHSMVAEQFWSYYTQNRWRFLDRSKTVEFKQDDLRTWDLARILQEVMFHYEQSLAREAELRKMPLDPFDEVVEKGNRDYRPTLYDFLAHRAVDFYMSRESGLTRPADQFALSDRAYLAPAREFVKVKLATGDTLSFDFHALKLLQDLLAFHRADGNARALIDVDLERLRFVFASGAFEDKEQLYERTLAASARDYANEADAARVLFAQASLYEEQGQRARGDARLSDRFAKAVALCEDAVRRYPNSSGAHDCRILDESIRAKRLGVEAETVIPPRQGFIVRVSYRNERHVWLKLCKFDSPEQIQALWKAPGGGIISNNDFVDRLLKRPPIRQWETALPDRGDYVPHEVDVPVAGLDIGHYVLLAGDGKQFRIDSCCIQHCAFQVSSIAWIKREQPNGLEYHIVDRASGAPLAGTVAQLWVREYSRRYGGEEYKKAAVMIADAHGHISVPGGKGHGEIYLELTNGSDRIRTNETYYYGREALDRDVHEMQTVYFTDRALYRPGQTVYYKGILLERHELTPEKTRIVKNEKVEVVLLDVNGQRIAAQNVKTNDFGTFSGAFKIPLGLLNGTFRLGDVNGQTSFNVEDYKRPKFAVSFDPATADYRLGQKITITGRALALAGFPIDNAKVAYRVVRRPYFPCWYWWWGSRNEGETEILSGTTMTKGNGEFAVTFTAAPDPGMPRDRAPEFSFSVTADVTDQNGETRSSETSLSAGYALIRLSASIPDMIDKSAPVPVLSIGAANASGMPQKAAGKVTVTRLKDPGRAFKSRLWERPDTAVTPQHEFYAAVEGFAYDDEDEVDKWEPGRQVLAVDFSTPDKDTFALKEIGSWEPGMYKVEASAKDREGTAVHDVRYVTVYSARDKKPPCTAVDWFIVPRATARPGEHVKLVLGTSEPAVRVMFETVHRGRIVATEFLTVDKEQKVIDVPVREEHRGGISFVATFVKGNRFYHHEVTVDVPWSNKQLDISFGTFRSVLLPGEKEEWRLTIKDPSGAGAAAELVAELYDASLDQILPHGWWFAPYPSFYGNYSWDAGELNRAAAGSDLGWRYSSGSYSSLSYDRLNWFGFYLQGYQGRVLMEKSMPMPSMAPPEVMKEERAAGAAMPKRKAMAAKDDEVARPVTQAAPPPPPAAKKPSGDAKAEMPRTNLRETAFFYPHLMTDKDGAVTVSFTMPEALTKWRMLGFAHTRDLKFGLTTNELITRKDLMVIPSLPRFLREGDRMVVAAKIVNVSAAPLSGTARLELFDASTLKPVDERFGNTAAQVNFTAGKGASAAVTWRLTIPEGVEAIAVRISAQAGTFSDGEEQVVPVLKNRMLVTESMPLPVRAGQTKQFTMSKLAAAGSSTTLRNHKLTLEFTANPAWYAVQALPYLMEFPFECMEQLFSRFYANAIASHIVNQRPRIKTVFDQWRALPSSDALLSNLEKNTELKSIILEATPWVMEATSESERKHRIALLFDLASMADQLSSCMSKLEKGQEGSGAWPWFPGMGPSRYITQHIVCGFAHLQQLRVLEGDYQERAHAMAVRALPYLDDCIRQDYDLLLKHGVNLTGDNLGPEQIHYLYMRSYYTQPPVAQECRAAVDYYTAQAKRYWLGKNRYLQGMIALAFHRWGDAALPPLIMKSIKEHALYSDEMGMYWKDSYGYYWYETPIETHALMIEAFAEIAKDNESVDGLRTWLLKNKQTSDWGNTKATAEACYALLLHGEDWLAEDKPPVISLGSFKVWPSTDSAARTQAGTGYFKLSWGPAEIKPEMGKVSITNNNRVVAWGALYWQYFEQLDKITPHATPLSLVKKLFVERPSATGPELHPITAGAKLAVGDRVVVRIELRVDRDMEFVHMRDMRAAGFEPQNVISQCKWQDNLCYYESTRDAGTHFFFDKIAKGTYVFEYPLRVSHEGDFSNGITSIECMYAPEFGSHSEGVRVKVGE